MDINLWSRALRVVLASVVLAFIFNYLFFAKTIGISVFIFVALLCAVVIFLSRQYNISLRRAWWLLPFILLFGLMPALRANEFLSVINVAAAFFLLLLLAQELIGISVPLMRFKNYIVSVIVGPLLMLQRSWQSISLVGQKSGQLSGREKSTRVIKGLLMALPVVFVLILLFAKADLAFSEFIRGIVDIDISQRTIQYLIWLFFSFFTTLGFLSFIFFPGTKKEVTEKPDEVVAHPERGVEVSVFLGIIAALFALFIGFQLTYLFGGQTNIVQAGFTYAEYARRGFWELLAVGFIMLIVLLATERFAAREGKKLLTFVVPALIVIAEVIIVIASAFKRLTLYIDAYGMTEMRFYVAAFIGLILVLFILLAIKFIQARQEYFFAFGTLISLIAFVLMVDLMNPDKFVMQTNIKQFEKTGKFDILHAANLSADAEPQRSQMLDKLKGDDYTLFSAMELSNLQKLQEDNKLWQATNYSRLRGQRYLENKLND
jgi:hypothetical protein